METRRGRIVVSVVRIFRIVASFSSSGVSSSTDGPSIFMTCIAGYQMRQRRVRVHHLLGAVAQSVVGFRVGYGEGRLRGGVWD